MPVGRDTMLLFAAGVTSRYGHLVLVAKILPCGRPCGKGLWEGSRRPSYRVTAASPQLGDSPLSAERTIMAAWSVARHAIPTHATQQQSSGIDELLSFFSSRSNRSRSSTPRQQQENVAPTRQRVLSNQSNPDPSPGRATRARTELSGILKSMRHSGHSLITAATYNNHRAARAKVAHCTADGMQEFTLADPLVSPLVLQDSQLSQNVVPSDSYVPPSPAITRRMM